MATATAAAMKLLFPEFTLTPDADIERWFAEFPLRWTPSRFRAQASMAMYLYTAHQLTCFPVDGTGGADVVRGPVTSEKVLDQSRSYGSSFELSRIPVSLQWLTTTKYGLQLVGIIMSRNAGYGRVIRTGASRIGTARDVVSE